MKLTYSAAELQLLAGTPLKVEDVVMLLNRNGSTEVAFATNAGLLRFSHLIRPLDKFEEDLDLYKRGAVTKILFDAHFTYVNPTYRYDDGGLWNYLTKELEGKTIKLTELLEFDDYPIDAWILDFA